jgi:TldD protein
MQLSHEQLFFANGDLHLDAAQSFVQNRLHGLDDGELFLEYSASENVSWEDGRIKSASSNTEKGFGLRGVHGESVAYAHGTDITKNALERAAEVVQAVNHGQAAASPLAIAPFGTQRPLYTDENPLSSMPFTERTALMAEIDAYLRAKEPRIKQVNASLSANWSVVAIIRPDGKIAQDIRPLVRLNISVLVEQNGRRESGSSGIGGRALYGEFVTPAVWKSQADEALRQALINLESVPAPAGEMPVVLGSGWCGVLLHEAIGHGLEGDFNRKKTSAFAGLMGQQVAAKGVTIVDDGTLENKRGSLSIDDEGTPTECTVLIEDGILKGYMQDRLNARLMGMRPTGNGRRESFAHAPLPRMTNTYALAGTTPRAEMIERVQRGIYAANFGGGQVDITSGKFVFAASEAYLIENGKITAPIKGATLIGNGPDVLKLVQAVGNDLALDKGVGTCGKAGQSVPAGVGQPSMLVEKITVGGTAL